MLLLLKSPLLFIRYVLLAINLLIFGSLHILALLLFGYEKGTSLRFPWIWGRITCFIVGARLKIKGAENLPKKGGLVFLFSHSSYLDIPILFGSYNGVVNFAAKSFVFKMPIIGHAGRLARAIEIPSDRAKAIAQYKAAEERLRNGDRFMISPEGGRSSGEELLPFKSGPFIFALNSKADLAPILIYKAHKIWPKEDKLPNLKALWSDVHVEFLPTVSVSTLTEENRKVRAKEIREDMLKVLENLQKKDS